MTDAIRRSYEAALREAALDYPESHEDFPWGERALKVKGKVFLFLFRDEGRLSLSVKLPESRHAALMLPFTRPTGYGLGKAGWVTASLEAAPYPPLEVLRAWLDESYRAVAPRRVVAALDAARVGAAVVAAGARRAAAKPARRAVAKKAAPAKVAPPKKAAPSKAAPSKAAPSKAAPSKAAPSKAAPSKAAPKVAPPKKAAPSKAAPKPTRKKPTPSSTPQPPRRRA